MENNIKKYFFSKDQRDLSLAKATNLTLDDILLAKYFAYNIAVLNSLDGVQAVLQENIRKKYRFFRGFNDLKYKIPDNCSSFQDVLKHIEKALVIIMKEFHNSIQDYVKLLSKYLYEFDVDIAKPSWNGGNPIIRLMVKFNNLLELDIDLDNFLASTTKIKISIIDFEDRDQILNCYLHAQKRDQKIHQIPFSHVALKQMSSMGQYHKGDLLKINEYPTYLYILSNMKELDDNQDSDNNKNLLAYNGHCEIVKDISRE